MPSLITVNTNSYQNETSASAYFSTRLGVNSWDTASVANREKALIMACQSIEKLHFNGFIATDTQALKWPRTDVLDIHGNEYSSIAYPTNLLFAQCEEALMLLKMDSDKGAASMDTRLAQGKNKVRIDDIQIEYSEPVKYGGNLLSQQAWDLLKPLVLQAPYGAIPVNRNISANRVMTDNFFKSPTTLDINSLIGK